MKRDGSAESLATLLRYRDRQLDLFQQTRFGFASVRSGCAVRTRSSISRGHQDAASRAAARSVLGIQQRRLQFPDVLRLTQVSSKPTFWL